MNKGKIRKNICLMFQIFKGIEVTEDLKHSTSKL